MYVQQISLHNVSTIKVDRMETLDVGTENSTWKYERVKITVCQQIGDLVTETILFAFGEDNKELKLEV